MDTNVQIELNGSKYLPATNDPPLGQLPTVYSTRKSSRRLNQIQLNADYVLDGPTPNSLTNLKDLKDPVHSAGDTTKKDPPSNGAQANGSVGHQSAANHNSPAATKQQRKWEQWQVDDTKWFFEALNDHGKDFNAIHSYMVSRSKKKGVAEELIKNKEQIRCYYNRQWNKICSIFECNAEQELAVLDKTTRQLYALINYGEMWKKNNFKNDLKIDAKFKAHLNELVFKGYTFLKIGKKGKNIKLKTPVCKALKKIYYFESIYKSVNQNLPKDIVVELVPANNYAWMTVHCLSQNPRVRIRCSLQKRFAALIRYLDDRWNDQKYNNLQIESLTNECAIKSPKNGEELEAVSPAVGDSTRKVFKVKPHPTHHKNLAGLKFTRIQPVPFNSQMDISLSAYLLKANSKQHSELKRKGKHSLNVNCSKGAKSNKEEASEAKPQPVANHPERSNTAHVLETVRGLNLLNDIANYKENHRESADDSPSNLADNLPNARANGNEPFGQPQEEKSLHLPDPPPNATIAEWLSANLNGKTAGEAEASDRQEASKETSGECSASKEAVLNSSADDSPKPTDQKEAKKNVAESQDQESIYNQMKKIVDPLTVKNGWSADDTEDLTIGELYLMLKKPAKIVLQYDWSLALDESNETTKEPKDLPIKTSGHTTNCSSLVAKLITAFTIELMALNKERVGSTTIEVETDEKNSTKSNRKTKKLKTNHSAEEQVEAANGEHETISLTSDSLTTTNGTRSAKNQATTKEAASSTPTADKFAVPCAPVPKPASHKPSNKGRIVNEQLLQEAKEQLNDIKFINTTRRNFRKPMMKPQPQIQLNLNTNQLLGNNLCQLFANQAGTALTTVPVNVANASNGQTALISVITQVNQNAVLPNQLQTINIDGTNATAIQINNNTTLNDLCSLVTSNACTPASNENELSNVMNGGGVVSSNLQAVPGLQAVSNHQANQTISNAQANDLVESRSDKNEPNQNRSQKFATLSQANQSALSNSFTMNSMTDLSMNSMLGQADKSVSDGSKLNNQLNSQLNNSINNQLNSHPFNDSCLKAISDDKSVGFSNLLDISLSDTIFNDSLPFPSDVSIESSFVKEHDQTLNTPIKLAPLQKSSIGHPTNSFTSQFGLFDSNLGNSNLGGLGSSLGSNLGTNGNRPESTSFSDGWINNLGSDLSLGNIFDCTNEQANFKSFESTPFKDKKDELFN